MNTQLISDEEAAGLKLLPFGRKHAVRILIEQLQPGQKLNVARKDFMWKRKTPAIFCNEVAKSGKAKFRIWKKWDKTGWVVERIE